MRITSAVKSKDEGQDVSMQEPVQPQTNGNKLKNVKIFQNDVK